MRFLFLVTCPLLILTTACFPDGETAFDDSAIVEVGCGPPSTFPFAPSATSELLHDGSAFSIVLLPEGYEDTDLASSWHDDAAFYVDAMLSDPDGVIGSAPDLFRITRVDASSPSHKVTSGTRDDTLLGACVAPDPLGLRPFITVDESHVRALAPDADAVIVVVRGAHDLERTLIPAVGFEVLDDTGLPLVESSGNVAPAIVILGDRSFRPTLQHELGHALAGLGDEYSEVEACDVPALPPFSVQADLGAPNLTLDPDGTRWAGLVDGAVEGGDRFSSCVFHPTPTCKMNDDASAFCPVCRDAIDRLLRARGGDDREPPRCAIDAHSDPGAVEDSIVLDVRAADANRGLSAVLSLDSRPILVVRAQDSPALFGSTTVPRARVKPSGSRLSLACSDSAGNSTTATWSLARAAPPP